MALNFIDHVQVHFKAGNGGNGCASIRREKYRPLAGPNGGSGGNGGSIFLIADNSLTSLLDFHFSRKRVAQNGEIGYGGSKDGKKGEDVFLPVPCGTVLKTLSGDFITELTQNGQKFLVVEGGKGGLGNESIANKQRKAPGFALQGILGEEAELVLELKMLADVALVGFPSAGKSSLIASISAARPKIADYPFTTLVPNLGVVNSHGYIYTVADVPGLIPGASQGKGLGHEFLRHIERCKIIAHIIDVATFEPGRDPISDLEAIENELKLYDEFFKNNGQLLQNKQKIVLINKIDQKDALEFANMAKEQLVERGYKVLLTSAAKHIGLDEVKQEFAKILQSIDSDLNDNDDSHVDNESNIDIRTQIQITPLKRKTNNHNEFEVTKLRDGDCEYYFVKSQKARLWVLQTDMSNDEAVGYLADRLAKLGIEDELVKMGAKEGDEVRISLTSMREPYLISEKEEYVFEFNPNQMAGAEILYSTRRGGDIRLEYENRVVRATRKEKRDEFHKRQDERAKTREQFEEQRNEGFWSDPEL